MLFPQKVFPSLAVVPVLLFSLAAGPGDKTSPPATQPSAKNDVAKKPVSIFEDTDQFHRLVILADASGSMIQKMAALKDQINKAVVNLTSEQAFSLIFMQEQTCERFNDKPVPAGADQKHAAGIFIDGITTRGTTDPIPGIEMAFKQKSEVIYLVTDGDFPDNDAVLRKIRALNVDKTVKVYTIAFVNRTDTDTAFIDLLKTIASESGGKYRMVKENDL